MKFLHTADWHLNDRLGRIDRTGDLRTAVERIAKACDEQKIDVLIVAGDLFSEVARADALRETIHHWQEVFGGFLARGGTILTCTGNHDNENFCQTLCHAMALASPTVGKPGEVVPAGRFYLAADPAFLRLADPKGKFETQFILMPYPSPVHYLSGDAYKDYITAEDKNTLLVKAFERKIQELRGHPTFDPRLPTLMIGHANVYGADYGPNLFRMDLRNDYVVSREQFAEQFAYVALGHIHKPQFLGHEHIRYSGSIEKMDLGEANDHKSFAMFDLGPQGLSGAIETVPLPSTPIYEIEVNDPEVDLPRLKADYADAERDLVKLKVKYTAGKHHLEEILHELEKLFPRWYDRDWVETSRLTGAITPGATERTKGFAETVRDYLANELMSHTESEREDVLRFADELLQEDA